MQRDNSMHEALGTPTGSGSLEMSPMDLQLAKVVAHLAQTNPAAIPGVLSAWGSVAASGATSQGPPTDLGRIVANVASLPDAAAQPTPTPAGPNGSFYAGGTLLQPNNQVRNDAVPRFDLQSASNIRAGWAASRGGRKSTIRRPAPPVAPIDQMQRTEPPQVVPKIVQQPLAKDHAVLLKNQPAGGLIWVPANEIFHRYTPWTTEKLAILRKLCRRRESMGYPVFTYGMSAEDVRREVAKCLPDVPELDDIDYYWMASSEDAEELFYGPRARSSTARNLDRFFEDGGLLIITPVVDVFGGYNVMKDFLQDWKIAVSAYEYLQARKSKNPHFKARVLGQGPVQASEGQLRGPHTSPANARESLRQRVGPAQGNQGLMSPARLAPVTGEAAATDSLVTEVEQVLSETSHESEPAPEMSQGKTSSISDQGSARWPEGLATPSGNAPTSPVDLTTPSTRGRRTPKSRRQRIQWSPLFSRRDEPQPRMTRNSARAGQLTNAETPVA